MKCEIFSKQDYKHPSGFSFEVSDSIQNAIANSCAGAPVYINYEKDYLVGHVKSASVIDDKVVAEIEFEENVDLDAYCGPCLISDTFEVMSIGIIKEHIQSNVLSIGNSEDKYCDYPL